MEIKKRLEAIAKEAIEAEFKVLADRIEKQGYRVDELLSKIRSEIIEQEKRIDKLEKLKVIGEIAEVGQIESRIEELTESMKAHSETIYGTGRLDLRIEALEVKQINHSALHVSRGYNERIKALEKEVQPEDPLEFKDPFLYDWHGKPDVGLEPGDWLLGYRVGEPSLWIGEFKDIDKEQFVWANWREIEKVKREGMGTTQFRLPKSSVVFLFRPKLKEKS